MDRKRAAAALLALAACIACSAAAPTANDHTALELMNGPTEGCYYNFQHYGEGDRIMTNEPCLNCTCHNRMLMCYLRVCPFTKPIGQDCTVEKRADQCCPIVTCPDVPVDLLTSTSTSSPAEYGATGIGKLDKYGCSINGKYFSEGSKVPSTPNKPCEHCYCIRNMTTCVMQECTLHVDGCTPIYHKDVCCPVRYSCDHPEDDILLLDDMTTTVRPTPGFLLTTTTAMPVTQITQDCMHDDQIFPDGTLIKTEKACEHCYCMKGDIVCVVQECGTPMENEGKNCTSLPPRHGQCCPDTYICEGDDHGTELTTEIIEQTTQPPRRVGVEGSGYRNEPDELYTEKSPFETDIEGSGEDYATDAPVITIEDVITDKIQPDIIDEIILATTEKEQISVITEPDKDQNTIPDMIPSTEISDLPETIAQTTEANVEIDSGLVETSAEKTKTTVANEYETPGFISKEDDFITTESAFTKEDNNIVSDEILPIKEQEKLPTTSVDLVDETTIKDEHLDESTDSNLPSFSQSPTVSTDYTTEVVEIMKEKEATTENLLSSSSTEKNKSEDGLLVIPTEEILPDITTMAVEKTDILETTTANPEINEIDENIPPPGRIPGEGDCLLNGITYRNNTIVPSSNNCHTSCKCTSSIIKCDPIICSSPPEYMENMNDCQPIYDSPDACCPTYVCSAKETIPPQSHSQMSGTESPKPITVSDCNGQDCPLDNKQKPISEPSSTCTSVDCLTMPAEKQDKNKIDCGLNDCADETQKPPINQDCSDNKCPILPVVACEGENCLTESVTSPDTHKTPMPENAPSLICDENGDCKKPEHTQQNECKDETCGKQENTETEVKAPLDCTEPECKTHEKPGLPSTMEESTDLAPEIISTDKATEITITELDKATESPEKTITTLTDENITENPTSEVTKLVETIPSEGLSETSETSSDAQGTAGKSDQTESPTTQSILEEHDNKKIPEETSIEHITESSGSQGVSEDEVTKETPTDSLTTNKEMDIDETSEHTEINSEDNSTDKIEITTEYFEIFTDSSVYSTKHEEATLAEDSENQKTGTEIPELDKNELEKLTPTEAYVDASEKDPTIKEVSEMHETKEENTEISVTLETMTTQTEKISTDFNEATETYEASHVTNKPHEESVETYTEKEKTTEEPESHEIHEIMTNKNIADIADVTQPSESQVTKDVEISTEKSVIVTESHIIPTNLPQSMQTKLDEVTTKDVNQETITDKNEIYTDPSDYFTAHHEETTSELSVQPLDNLSTTQITSEVTEEPLSEKVTTFTESSETLQTKTEEIMHESGQPVTEKQEVHTKTPDHLREKSDEDQTVGVTVTEKAFTEAIESDSTKMQETFTESPKVHVTTLKESITKDYEMKIDSSSTELPVVQTTLAETIEVTEKQNIDIKEANEPITDKESHISDDAISTTSESFREPTSETDQHLTEKPEVAITESTPKQTIAETDSYVQPTSGEPNQVDEHDLEPHQLETTTQDNVMAHEITTIKPMAITESQTKSPSRADENLYETSTDIQKELPLQTDINKIYTTTQHSSKKPDELSTHPVSQSEYTTEYATESQNVHTTVMDASQSQLDSSTKASPFDHKPEESTDTSKPHEETEDILSKVTTINPQTEKEEVDKETTLPKDTEETSHDMEKTTASLSSVEEKETESLSYTTESNINIIEQETAKTTTGVIVDKEMHETTEKSISEEEHLPHSTYEYMPSEGITEDITSQTLHDMSTEKIKVQDGATLAPVDMGTTQSELFTESEESSMTKITEVGKEKEIVTESPHSYVTSVDLDGTSAPADKAQPNESTFKTEEDNQEFSTPSVTKPEEEKDVTKTPIEIVTDVDQITETSMPDKDEISIESTTKTFDDQSLEAEKVPTVSDSYTTESQKEVSEKTKEVTTQHQEITTVKIITTENPEYLSTSHVHETTLSSFEEEVNIPQQETTTEKLADQTNPVSDLQPTSSESTAQSTEEIPLSTIKEEILNTEKEEETTQKSLEDLDKASSHFYDYQTTESVPKDDNTSELSHKEISTMSPESSEPEKDNNEVPEIITNTSEMNLETVTEKEKSPEPVDIEAHIVTTQRNEVDIVTPESPETIPTDSDTETKESDILEHEHDITGIPVLTETQTSTVATKLITEKPEITETESLTKDVATTESQYTTVTELKESSTEATDLSSKEPELNINDEQKWTTTVPEAVSIINEDTEVKITQSTNIPYQPEVTTSGVDSQEQIGIKDKLTTFVTEDTNIYSESTKPTITEKEKLDQPEIYSTQSPKESEIEEPITQKESDKITTESVPTISPNVDITGDLSESTAKQEKPYTTEEIKQVTDSDYNLSKTTPFSVELEEHTHRVVDEITTKSSLEEITTTMFYETHASQIPERGDEIPDDISIFTHSTEEYPVSEPSKTTVATLEDKEHPVTHVQEQIDEHTTVTPLKSESEITLVTEKLPTPTSSAEPVETKTDTTVHKGIVITSTMSQIDKDKDYTTESIEITPTPTSTLTDVHPSSDKDVYISSEKPLQPEIPEESEEKLTPEIPKETTSKIEEEISTYSPPHIDNVTKPKEKPGDTTLRPTIPEVPKPEFIDDNVEVPSPDFPPSGGYGQEPDYIDEDQAFGPGTCRYGGKVYVSAQQIPRDDPCDFCFCFRSDIICLQQSCPPPIHGCHEEPIQGFCCPRYECPVSMATTLNVTTTTTTTTTTLPPHFLPHAYKGAAQRRGCQIKGHTYKVGEVVRASSGPCLHCTCGGDGQMKCDPKACTPEPMLRQMIAAAVSAKRRR